jgi:hypothetical protein
MTFTMTPGGLLYLGSAIVFGTTLVFHCAYYIGRFVGRLEAVEKAVKDVREEIVELRTGV